MRYRDNVAALFDPKSIAVVGASPSDGPRRTILRNVGILDFSGSIYVVNPNYEEIDGYTSYPTLSSLPEVPDTVVVATGPGLLEDVVREAVELGVRAAITFTGGFADAGHEGAEAQDRLVQLAESGGLALLGPNCQGTLAFGKKTGMYLLPVDPSYPPGNLALISQSGSVTDALANNKRGVRWSYVSSTGNEAVVDATDLLAYLIEQPDCFGVCMFLEAVRNPEYFVQTCNRAKELGKPVMVLKSGRTEAAQATAAAHTGALASPDRLYDALFAKTGVIRADSMDELLNIASLVQLGRPPAGTKIAAILGSGGLAELLHDGLEGSHLDLVGLTPSTVSRLKTLVGPWVRVANPLDYWPSDVENIPGMVETLGQDPNVDILIDIGQLEHGPTGDGSFGRSLDALASVADSGKLPVKLLPIGGAFEEQDALAHLDRGIALLSGMRSGMEAITKVVRYGDTPNFGRDIPSIGDEQSASIQAAFSALNGQPSGGPLALAFSDAAGVPLTDYSVVHDPEQAVIAGESLGYPVVVKSASDSDLHKSDHGGVRLNVASPDELRSAYAAVSRESLGTALVQRQVTGNVELIVGLQRDPQLGLFLVAGLGGVWTELIEDVAFSPVGVSSDEALVMLQSLQAFPILRGLRGSEAVDLDEVIEVILAVDRIGRVVGDRLESLELNPVILTSAGAKAVDAVVIPTSTSY